MKRILSLIAMLLVVLCFGMVTFASPRMVPCPGRENGLLCSPVNVIIPYRDGCYEIYRDVFLCEFCNKEILVISETPVGYYHNWLPNGFCSECGATFN